MPVKILIINFFPEEKGGIFAKERKDFKAVFHVR